MGRELGAERGLLRFQRWSWQMKDTGLSLILLYSIAAKERRGEEEGMMKKAGLACCCFGAYEYVTHHAINQSIIRSFLRSIASYIV
jgi:hypothetical protein